MAAKVVLRITQDDRADEEFLFSERSVCLVGRHRSCRIRIIEKDDPRRISRHHCLLDINPPDIRIRDFGSRTGTYVNGKLIGKRHTVERVDGVHRFLPEVDLKDGDEIRIRNTVLRVSIHLPVVCASCSVEIAEHDAESSQVEPGTYRCSQCREQDAVMKLVSSTTFCPSMCARCGRDVSNEISSRRGGRYVCQKCRDEPLEVLKSLLESANSTGRPETLAGFSIVKELGRGGFGLVGLVRHEESGEHLALKIMLPRVAAKQKAVDDFLREARTMQALRHENVVQLCEAGCSDGVFFMTLEFCNSGDADRLVKSRGGKVPIDEALPIILATLDGLQHAHESEVPVKLADGSIQLRRGVVHRDLKPHNILLHSAGDQRIAKVADFGMAKAFDAAGLSGHTMTGVSAGSPVFMCRQQVTDFRYCQPDVDVWAAAATLYYMLAGRYPRDFGKDKDVWVTLLQGSVVPIRRRNASIPSRIAELIDVALDDRKELHFKTAREFKQALLAAT